MDCVEVARSLPRTALTPPRPLPRPLFAPPPRPRLWAVLRLASLTNLSTLASPKQLMTSDWTSPMNSSSFVSVEFDAKPNPAFSAGRALAITSGRAPAFPAGRASAFPAGKAPAFPAGRVTSGSVWAPTSSIAGAATLAASKKKSSYNQY